jgi:hypothetical protein
MSPVRRDFRAEERPPPAKRMRGPVGAYPPNSAPSGQYFGSSFCGKLSDITLTIY